MKLPNGSQATIDPRKVTDYCLSPDHEDGQHKAHLFQSLLGLTLDNADLLLDTLRIAATTEEAVLGKQDKYGQRYVIDFEFAGPSRTATIRSAWIIGPNSNVPRLVTCYIHQGAIEMTKQRPPKLFDMIAVTNCPDDAEVAPGDVGTVVELLPPDGIEVEFLDRDGRTRCVATLNVNDVLVLNRERTKVA